MIRIARPQFSVCSQPYLCPQLQHLFFNGYFVYLIYKQGRRGEKGVERRKEKERRKGEWVEDKIGQGLGLCGLITGHYECRLELGGLPLAPPG